MINIVLLERVAVSCWSFTRFIYICIPYMHIYIYIYIYIYIHTHTHTYTYLSPYSRYSTYINLLNSQYTYDCLKCMPCK
jgi:hypothetical protein